MGKKSFIYIGVAASLFLAMVVSIPYFAMAETAFESPIQSGENGPVVSELQQFLATDREVYPEGLVTGYYGSLTEAAVKRYQCKKEIVCSGTPKTTGYGRVGPRTLVALNLDIGVAGGSVDVYAPNSVGRDSGYINVRRNYFLDNK